MDLDYVETKNTCLFWASLIIRKKYSSLKMDTFIGQSFYFQGSFSLSFSTMKKFSLLSKVPNDNRSLCSVEMESRNFSLWSPSWWLLFSSYKESHQVPAHLPSYTQWYVPQRSYPRAPQAHGSGLMAITYFHILMIQDWLWLVKGDLIMCGYS